MFIFEVNFSSIHCDDQHFVCNEFKAGCDETMKIIANNIAKIAEGDKMCKMIGPKLGKALERNIDRTKLTYNFCVSVTANDEYISVCVHRVRII